MKNKIKALFVILLILSITGNFSCSKSESSSESEKSPAYITFLVGDIQVKAGENTWIDAEMGSGLNQGDMVKAGNDSFCDVQIGDASVIRVKPGTEIQMKELYFDEITKQENTRVKVSVGKLLIKPKKLLKKSSFEVETPSAVCGVRGTKFMVSTGTDEKTKIAVTEGTVKVRKRVAAIDDVQEGEKTASQEEIKALIEEASVELNANDSAIVDDKINLELEESIRKLLARGKTVNKENLIKELELLSLQIEKEVRKIEVEVIEINVKKELEEVDKIQIMSMKAGQLKLGTINIDLQTEGAEVMIDGKVAGTESVSKKILAGKSYTITASKEGFEDFSATIDLDVNAVENIVINLEAIEAVNVEPEKPKTKIIKLNRIAWKYKAGNTVEVKPVIYSGKVYVASQDQNVYCFDENGKIVWKKSTGFAISCTPVIDNGILYIGTTDTEGKFLAMNAKSGAVVWTKKFGPVVFSEPEVVGNKLYIGTTSNKLFAVNKKTGAVIWEFATESGIYSSPVHNKGSLYFGCEDNNVYSLNAETGEKNWAYKTGHRIIGSSVVISGNNIYIGSYDSHIYSLGLDGSLKWKYDTGKRIISSPVVSGNSVYVGSGNGTLFALNKNSGALIWKKSLGSKLQSSPIVHNGLIYIGSYDNKMYGIKASNGNIEWSENVGTSISASPTIYGEKVFVGSDSGEVFSFNTIIKKEVPIEE